MLWSKAKGDDWRDRIYIRTGLPVFRCRWTYGFSKVSQSLCVFSAIYGGNLLAVPSHLSKYLLGTAIWWVEAGDVQAIRWAASVYKRMQRPYEKGRRNTGEKEDCSKESFFQEWTSLYKRTGICGWKWAVTAYGIRMPDFGNEEESTCKRMSWEILWKGLL